MRSWSITGCVYSPTGQIFKCGTSGMEQSWNQRTRSGRRWHHPGVTQGSLTVSASPRLPSRLCVKVSTDAEDDVTDELRLPHRRRCSPVQVETHLCSCHSVTVWSITRWPHQTAVLSNCCTITHISLFYLFMLVKLKVTYVKTRYNSWF